MLVLSLFPGIDIFGRAFTAEGWTVLRGGDPIYGGDIRAEHYPPGTFAGVIGGPPCQTFSSLAHLVRANGHEPKFGNLIPEFERCVGEALPDWFVMENVPAAPVPVVPGYGVKSFLLDNSMLAGEDGWGLEQRRVRRFSFGMRGRKDEDVPSLMRWIDLAMFVLPDVAPTVNTGIRKPWSEFRAEAISAGKPDPDIQARRRRQAVLSDPNAVPVKIGGSGKVKRSVRQSAVTGTGNGGGPGRPDRRKGAVTSSDGSGQVKQCRYRLADALRLQGLPGDFLDHCPWTAEGKLKAVANGVAMPTGRAVARAIKLATR